MLIPDSDRLYTVYILNTACFLLAAATATIASSDYLYLYVDCVCTTYRLPTLRVTTGDRLKTKLSVHHVVVDFTSETLHWRLMVCFYRPNELAFVFNMMLPTGTQRVEPHR